MYEREEVIILSLSMGTPFISTIMHKRLFVYIDSKKTPKNLVCCFILVVLSVASVSEKRRLSYLS